MLKTSGELSIHYKKLCLCLGGKPKLIKFKDENIIGIRDLDSVAILQQKLKNARRVVVVGNGGIALELVYVSVCTFLYLYEYFCSMACLVWDVIYIYQIPLGIAEPVKP